MTAITSVAWGNLMGNDSKDQCAEPVSPERWKTMQSEEFCERNFRAYDLNSDGMEKLHSVRRHCKALALEICALVPEGRERSVALTKLEEVMFWANAGISRP